LSALLKSHGNPSQSGLLASYFCRATKVEQVFSDFLHFMVPAALALRSERPYVQAVASVNADVVSSPTRRKGMKMTPSNTLTIAGSRLVRINLQSVKRWPEACRSKRM
jgi:hypothetical protein